MCDVFFWKNLKLFRFCLCIERIVSSVDPMNSTKKNFLIGFRARLNRVRPSHPHTHMYKYRVPPSLPHATHIYQVSTELVAIDMQIALSYSNRGAGKAETKLRTNGRIFDFNSFSPLENRLNHGQCFDSTWCILCLPYREQIRSAGLKIKSSWWDVGTTAIDFRVCVRFTNPLFS